MNKITLSVIIAIILELLVVGFMLYDRGMKPESSAMGTEIFWVRVLVGMAALGLVMTIIFGILGRHSPGTIILSALLGIFSLFILLDQTGVLTPRQLDVDVPTPHRSMAQSPLNKLASYLQEKDNDGVRTNREGQTIF